MKYTVLILPALILLPFACVIGQNNVALTPGQNKQSVSLRGDTVINITLDRELLLQPNDNTTEYSISTYKNVDFSKAGPMQLQLAGLHPEIYISNTHKGVIIISSAEAGKGLKDFKRTLELSPALYESSHRQDTLLVSPYAAGEPEFDYTKVSSIRQDYKNAFNYKVDPRTGISWSKGKYGDFETVGPLGRMVYDLVIILNKAK